MMKRVAWWAAMTVLVAAALQLAGFEPAARVAPGVIAADQPSAKPSPSDATADAQTPTSPGPAAERPDYASVRIAEVPHVKQKPDFCGEACAAMYLAKLGQRINQDDVFDQGGVDPELGRGCHTKELARALERIGFQPGNTWYSVSAARAAEDLEANFRGLHADLAAGVPSIVCMHYDESPEASEHFRLVLGYDRQTDEVLYHEPAAAQGAYARMPRPLFLKLWPLKYDPDRWTLIRLRLAAGEIRNVHSTAQFTDADYAQRVLAARQRAPEGFSIVIQRPFVVVGNQASAEVRRWATGTIQWAVERLKEEYFEKDPTTILDIWLFKDEPSYNQYTREIFGDTPDTPFGYFSHQHRALIMNIDTGGGTLVHEIVHPFMAANFPKCPAWFNEGLASLYEQSGENRGRIWGRTNWRLAGLQEVIQPKPKPEEPPGTAPSANRDAKPAAGTETIAEREAAEPAGESAPPRQLPSFQTLCGTTTYEFYSEDPGSNYAQARYLCYYLQQQGLLRQYYRQFRANVQDDPTGYETLKSVLNIKDEEGMTNFEQAWKAWVLKLRYP